MEIETTTCLAHWLCALRMRLQVVRPRGLAVVVLLAVGLGGCDEPSPPARAQASDPPERMVTFTLGGKSFAMPLPAVAKVGTSGDSNSISVLLPHTRSPRWLELATGPNQARTGSDVRYDQSMPLANGGRLEFHISDDTAGGSGGPTATLFGRIQIGDIALSFGCGDQGELSLLQPDWCLPYLTRLTVAERGQ
jgi:hypothetical protein